MENFIAFNPTKLHFGRGVLKDLGPCASELGKKALLVYGSGSVLRNGSYRDTVQQLESQGIEITEFKGIKPNPRVEEATAAVKSGRDAEADMVVAVGGGSVIDSAKIIAICISEDCDPWELMSRKHIPTSGLPLIAVLTLAATGTEMNAAAVLQNSKTGQKIGLRNELMYPDHSFLDPSYTLSVPENYTAYGIVDLVAHCLEAWFGHGDASLSDRFVVEIIKEAMEFGPELMKDLQNYELRERIMWAATCALNNTTMHGRTSGDWGVHAFGHTLSFLYDTPHGASLSILYPAWMKVMKKRAGDRILALGKALFDASDIEETIEKITAFFSMLGSPVLCREAGIEEHKLTEILALMNKNKAQGLNFEFSDEERELLLSFV
ncbi:MAG: iron-containing alcohol dehydrogenase [Bacteroidota bacterium]